MPTTGLGRATVITDIPGILRAGDYVSSHNPDKNDADADDNDANDNATFCNAFASHYPATIEAAVRSGVTAASYFCNNRRY